MFKGLKMFITANTKVLTVTSVDGDSVRDLIMAKILI